MGEQDDLQEDATVVAKRRPPRLPVPDLDDFHREEGEVDDNVEEE